MARQPRQCTLLQVQDPDLHPPCLVGQESDPLTIGCHTRVADGCLEPGQGYATNHVSARGVGNSLTCGRNVDSDEPIAVAIALSSGVDVLENVVSVLPVGRKRWIDDPLETQQVQRRERGL